MRYKKLTKEQILISLDRLTRFKNTKEKYLRVFADIISSCLIEPRLRKDEIINMDYSVLAGYVSEIFNESLYAICKIENLAKQVLNNRINKILKDYENAVFVNDEETQKLLNNNIDFQNAVHLIEENSPVNLKWLQFNIEKNNFDELRENRRKYNLKFPIEKVILAEGITEEILLPAFSAKLGYDFYSEGVQIIAAGGKNQVVKMYYQLSEELKIPIFILLDKDADENIRQIEPKLRSIDKIHLVSCGEFEDLLPKSLILKTINSQFENFLTVALEDIESDLPMAKLLTELYRTKGLHEFKKAEFARLVRAQINDNSDISEEISNIIKELKEN